MLARAYLVPLQLCHGLSQAMTHLEMTFPEAFRLLWDKKKIIVAGHCLIYDLSASKLWDAGAQPPGTPPAGEARPASARDRDVLSTRDPPCHSRDSHWPSVFRDRAAPSVNWRPYMPTVADGESRTYWGTPAARRGTAPEATVNRLAAVRLELVDA